MNYEYFTTIYNIHIIIELALESSVSVIQSYVFAIEKTLYASEVT